MSELARQSKSRALALLAVQAVLVLSIAGKYLYERKVCPRVWARAVQYDPNAALRGRYLAMQLVLDGCSLPRDEEHHMDGIIGSMPPDHGYYRWLVRPVSVAGKLTPVLANPTDRPEMTEELTLWGSRSCDQASLSESSDFFIPDAAKSPFPLAKGHDLWVEVTVPPVGPPRPIQLAVSDGRNFTPLTFR